MSGYQIDATSKRVLEEMREICDASGRMGTGTTPGTYPSGYKTGGQILLGLVQLTTLVSGSTAKWNWKFANYASGPPTWMAGPTGSDLIGPCVICSSSGVVGKSGANGLLYAHKQGAPWATVLEFIPLPGPTIGWGIVQATEDPTMLGDNSVTLLPSDGQGKLLPGGTALNGIVWTRYSAPVGPLFLLERGMEVAYIDTSLLSIGPGGGITGQVYILPAMQGISVGFFADEGTMGGYDVMTQLGGPTVQLGVGFDAGLGIRTARVPGDLPGSVVLFHVAYEGLAGNLNYVNAGGIIDTLVIDNMGHITQRIGGSEYLGGSPPSWQTPITQISGGEL